jgi:hypothetical protein
MDLEKLDRAVAVIQAGRRDAQAVARTYRRQPTPWSMLETRTTRNRVEHFDWGYRCVPQRPDDDRAWFVVDETDDWRTRWGRWRDVGRA